MMVCFFVMIRREHLRLAVRGDSGCFYDLRVYKCSAGAFCGG
jgi:hypothetical protein